MRIYNAGFTLIELMVAITLLVITMTLAIPSMRSTIQNNRIVTLTNELVASLNLARSEAVKRGVSVSVCPAADQNFSACGNDWNSGWLVFVNPDENGTFANNASEILIRAQQITGTGMGITTAPASSLATYDSAGFAAAGTANLSFALSASECTGNHVRNVAISVTGRITTTASACP